VADLDADGTLRNERVVAGGPGESVVQPGWSPGNVLHFVSDRSEWWNLYRETDEGTAALAPLAAEFAEPHWVFGLSNYAFLPDGRIVCVYSQRGFDQLAVITPDGHLDPIPCGYTVLGDLTTIGTTIWALGASPTQGNSVLRISLDGAAEAVRHSQKHEMDPEYLSSPEAIEFPTENGLTAHALFYRPANKDFAGPAGERPPLIVISHGGPTSAADSSLDLDIQFWTSHGFALVDVNYGGSSGYGRPYRDRLKGQWGVVDTDDCIAAARYLVERGDADGARVAVRGGSAGGYTTLNALTQRRFFRAGASYYGLADLEMFVTGGTHKFEERYLISLVGPYPEAKELYRQRSPIHFVEQIDCPVIVFQGLEDAIVPPEQAEIIVAALANKKLPHAYLAFAGEQHGFRKAANIVRSLEAELYFYGRVFGFVPAEHIEPVEIKNL
jgi:dipeptidyl aminopeptidase/acylaminoacyl peptidase